MEAILEFLVEFEEVDVGLVGGVRGTHGGAVDLKILLFIETESIIF